MERNPDVLIVGQPTRGVDIGAIEFIHRRLVALRDAGKAILLVSVELDEILALAAEARAVVVGPGLGRDPGTQALVLRLWQALPQPAVFDSDRSSVRRFGPVKSPRPSVLKKLLPAIRCAMKTIRSFWKTSMPKKSFFSPIVV